MSGEVLRKKLRVAAAALAAGGPGADRGWRLAFARAARDMMGLTVDFVDLAVSRHSLAELLEFPPERSLILMLEGPQEGLGLMVMSGDLLNALVEMMTMGRCSAKTPDPRKCTRTDAAMVAPLCDLALANLEECLAEDPDLVWTSGFRYASFIEEARSLALLLEDISYRVIRAKLSLARGAREGEILLMLPADGQGTRPQLTAASSSNILAGPAFTSALTTRVEAADCPLTGVLASLTMSVAKTMALAPDMLLPLPDAALDQIRLQGLDGHVVATGRLGQHRGMRAVRLNLASDGAEQGSDHSGTTLQDLARPGDQGGEAIALPGDPATQTPEEVCAEPVVGPGFDPPTENAADPLPDLPGAAEPLDLNFLNATGSD